MGSELTRVVCPAGAAEEAFAEYDCVDFPSPLSKRNILYELDSQHMTQEEVMTFMIKQFQEGETNNGLLLGFVLKEMDEWAPSQNSVLAHFRVG